MSDGSGRAERLRRFATLRRLAAVLLASVVSGGAPASLAAKEAAMLDLAGLVPLSEAALAQLRGGFQIGPFFVNFGVKVTTIVNNVRVLETNFNLVGPNEIVGPRVTVLDRGPSAVIGPRTVARDIGPAEPLPPSPAGGGTGAGNAASTGPLSGPQLGDGSRGLADTADAAPPPATSDSLDIGELARGVQVNLPQGVRILQSLDRGLATQIVASASGQSIRHSTELNVFVTNFSQVVNQGRLRMGANNVTLDAIRMGLALGR